MKEYSLAELATMLDGQVIGDAQMCIGSIAALDSAQSGQMAFLANAKYRKQLNDSKASGVLLRQSDVEGFTGNAVVVDDPYLAYAKLAQLLDTTPRPASCIHVRSVIDASANIGKNVSIGANTVIESDVTIGDNCSIAPNCFIGQNTVIGDNCTIWANVSIYHRVIIGSNCIIQASAVIGSDGFGFAPSNGQWVKIPQVGGVNIGNGCEIGACTTIDRGALGDTVIGEGCIIDNLVQIAHNVELGNYCAIAANTAIAGSTSIGNHCIIGGACGISGHLIICDGVTITGMSMVIKNIELPGVYSSGMPTQTNREWRKNGARYRQLDDMAKRLKRVERQLK
ncbi:MAG: UDP-3-O-(3-hydroxymyristoyl)glucosamine N-acyltransferase [Psychrobium sp.]|nr:UDP-3-O-(3-hydroxymyristoyl)glucosamine N-acyltransferase [Psychrobium sp.]